MINNYCCLEDIKRLLQQPFIEKFNLNSQYPARLKYNKELFNSCKIEMTLQELIFLIKNKNNLENLHIFCPTCGKKNIFRSNENKYGLHCSYKCASNDHNKISQTLLTKELRYGKDNISNQKKTKETFKIRYNVTNASQIKEVKLKKDKTKKEKYGDAHYNNRDKARSTYMIRYGVDHYSKTQKYKDKMFAQKEEIEKKKNLTRKKNGTFGNKSKIELNCYNLLLTKFPDAIHHYYDEKRYPFECDMYIPSLDLFIECHFYWKHGDYKDGCHCAFDKNNINHINKLNLWKNKNKEGYNHAIYIWTISDPLKLATFKKNKLNYKIFYTEKEFKDWFNII